MNELSSKFARIKKKGVQIGLQHPEPEDSASASGRKAHLPEQSDADRTLALRPVREVPNRHFTAREKALVHDTARLKPLVI